MTYPDRSNRRPDTAVSVAGYLEAVLEDLGVSWVRCWADEASVVLMNPRRSGPVGRSLRLPIEKAKALAELLTDWKDDER